MVCPTKIESFAHGGSATKVLPAKGRLVRMVGGGVGVSRTFNTERSMDF